MLYFSYENNKPLNLYRIYTLWRKFKLTASAIVLINALSYFILRLRLQCFLLFKHFIIIILTFYLHISITLWYRVMLVSCKNINCFSFYPLSYVKFSFYVESSVNLKRFSICECAQKLIQIYSIILINNIHM